MTSKPNDRRPARLSSPASFDAPRELVFQAFTDPKHVAAWWGPKGFTTTIRQMDVRPGGIWRLVMRGPDGTRLSQSDRIHRGQPARAVGLSPCPRRPV